MNQKKRLSVKTVVLIGMFGALAAVLETFQIPGPFAPPFYKLDFTITMIDEAVKGNHIQERISVVAD